MKRDPKTTKPAQPEWAALTPDLPIRFQRNPYLEKVFNLRLDLDEISFDIYGCQLRETKDGDLFISAPARKYQTKDGKEAYAPQARVNLGKHEEAVIKALTELGF